MQMITIFIYYYRLNIFLQENIEHEEVNLALLAINTPKYRKKPCHN